MLKGITELCDQGAITKAIRLIVGEGNVTELRALDATTSGDNYAKTYSGYFDDPVKLAAAAATLRSAKGIYFVPNAVNPALLARAANRLRPAGKNPLTTDTDIQRRRYLLVDCDPKRPAGISASDDEHAAALAKAEDVTRWLADQGWSQPVFATSGNGAHLLYPIDQPGDDGGLVERCLKALAARFDDDAVTIDTTVHNPARIWKLYGTIACKGDSTPDRPWRMSRIITAPTTLDVVADDLLRQLAAEVETPQPSAPPNANTNGNHHQAFDLDAFIRRHGLDVTEPKDWNGRAGRGRRWKFNTSPLCEHHDGAAHLEQHASGAISAGCHWEPCKWTWQDLREKFDPRSERQSTAQTNGAPQPVEAVEPWPAICSLDSPDLPPFPTHTLPPALRNWVEAESRATQTPADLAALLSLAVCSAGIARRVVVEPRQGWQEPTNLFVAVLLEPGNRKSAVFADAIRPLRELEAELIEASRPQVSREQSVRRQKEARLRKLEKIAAEKGDQQAADDAGDLAEELAMEAEPVLPRLLVDDATAEKLGMLLAEQGGRIASMSPEGGCFDLMAGLYSKNGMPQFGVYLMGHSGDDLVTDRVSRKSVRVQRPALTCAYAMQPTVICGLGQNPAFRGRGLLARFLYAAPPSWIGRRTVAADSVPTAVQEAYSRVVRTLAETDQEAVLLLDGSAARRLRDWEEELEAMLGDGGAMEFMRDWGAKLAGATLRLAAVLHCAEHGAAGAIGEPTIAAAVEIARYLIPHADAVLGMMMASESHAADDARYLLRWIERHERRQFSKTEAQQHGRRRFPKADDIDPALDQLIQRGYIRRRPVEGPPTRGRPPSATFDVNPAVFEHAGKRTEYSGNSHAFENEHAGKRTKYSGNSTDTSSQPPPRGISQNIQDVFLDAQNSDADQWGEV